MNSQQQKVVLFLVLVVFSIGFVVERTPWPTPDLFPDTYGSPGRLNPKPTFKYLVYGSQLYGGSWEYLLGYKDTPFVEAKCKYSNCYLTRDNFNPIAKSQYSAVIYHGRDMCSSNRDQGIADLRKTMTAPFIFLLLESPSYDCGLDFHRFDNLFNWTLTYRRNSDLVLPYGNFKTSNHSYAPPQKKPNRKLIFWLVSHLGSHGGRDAYVAELEKHVPVERHGVGTGHHCPPETRSLHGLECKARLAREYKFYLAFENSLCQDYVTEKFFDIIQFPVVPVVYGLANYSAFAPPHSFIDVRDFQSPKDLGEYLMYLDRHDEEYVKYFKWKEKLRVSNLNEESQRVLCEICERVNRVDEFRQRAYTGKELSEWWRGTPDNPSCRNAKKVIPGLQ